MFVVVPLNCCRCCYGVMVVQAKGNIPKTKKELDEYSIEPLEHLPRFHYVSAYYSFFLFIFLFFFMCSFFVVVVVFCQVFFFFSFFLLLFAAVCL